MSETHEEPATFQKPLAQPDTAVTEMQPVPPKPGETSGSNRTSPAAPQPWETTLKGMHDHMMAAVTAMHDKMAAEMTALHAKVDSIVTKFHTQPPKAD